MVAHAYPGDRPDVTQFATMIDLLSARHAVLAAQAPLAAQAETCTPAEMTVVFDAGQNSVANFTHLSDTGLAFEGSIPPSYVADLLALPAKDRRIVDADRFAGLSALETRRVVYGTARRVRIPGLCGRSCRSSRSAASRLGCRRSGWWSGPG